MKKNNLWQSIKNGVGKFKDISLTSLVVGTLSIAVLAVVTNKLSSYNLPTVYTTVTQTTDGGTRPSPDTRIEVSSPTEHFEIPSSRTVIVSGEVGDQSREVAKQILALSKESSNPIYLLLNSPGGSVLDGVLIIQAIQASRAPVNTVCTQICASMAAMIFEYGAKRYLGNKAILMFHPASGGAQGELDKMVSRLTFMQGFIGGIENYIATRAGMSFAEYKFKSGTELWVEGNNAVNMKLADSLVLLEGDVVFSDGLRFEGANNKGGSSNSKVRSFPGVNIDLFLLSPIFTPTQNRN